MGIEAGKQCRAKQVEDRWSGLAPEGQPPVGRTPTRHPAPHRPRAYGNHPNQDQAGHSRRDHDGEQKPRTDSSTTANSATTTNAGTPSDGGTVVKDGTGTDSGTATYGGPASEPVPPLVPA